MPRARVGFLNARVHSAATEGYGRAADAYARVRPSYPDAAVDWILAGLGNPSHIVEIGAGTGNSPAQLVRHNIAVLAVEPVEAMRDRLSELGPLVTPLAATAENLPLGTGAVDSLVASQSLHWADVAAALAEFERVLQDRGAVGLIWNFRDVSVPWQRDLDGLLSELRGSAPHSRDGRWEQAVSVSAFEITAAETWHWSLTTDEAGLLDRVRSVSYVAALPETVQQSVDRRVLDLLAEHGLTGAPLHIDFPYVTEAYVLQKRSTG